MELKNYSRRRFCKRAASALTAASLPGGIALSQGCTRVRLEWHDFRNTSAYPAFVDAIARMRANTDATSPASWMYWTKVHVSHCPHGIPYFLAWHRGYLYYFEQQLRQVSGNAELTLPYWDYYRYPIIPAEFTHASADNPLYVKRINTNVFNALSLTPFTAQFTNFQRGTNYSFEAQLEYRPHGPIHNIIGGDMAKIGSPLDPVFWVHHAQIDRLWAAWITAGAGRHMPAQDDPYWADTLSYGAGLSIARSTVMDTRTYLGYCYQNETLPKSYPVLAPSSASARSSANMPGNAMQAQPRPEALAPSAPRRIGANRFSLGGVRNIRLTEQSISAEIAVSASAKPLLQSVLRGARTSPFGRVQPGQGMYKSVQVVLDDVRLTRAGMDGGFFYDIFLALPKEARAASLQDAHPIGGIGPFEIAGAQHHDGPACMTYPVTPLLRSLTSDGLNASSRLSELTISFLRINGETIPKGMAISVGELRLEVSDDPE